MNGKLPFYSEDSHELQEMTLKKEPKFSKECHKLFGKDAIDLATKMLEKNPKKRIAIEMVITHPWFL